MSTIGATRMAMVSVAIASIIRSILVAQSHISEIA